MESTVRETGKGEVGKGENYTGLTLTMTSRLNNLSSALNTLSAAPEAPQGLCPHPNISCLTLTRLSETSINRHNSLSLLYIDLNTL